jgi:hypothetical protein
VAAEPNRPLVWGTVQHEQEAREVDQRSARTAHQDTTVATSRLPRLRHTLIVVLAMLAGVAGPAFAPSSTAAASETTGGYVAGTADCDFGRINANSPSMFAVVYQVPGLYIGNWVQDVAFRASVARWDGRSWVTAAVGPWKRATANHLDGTAYVSQWLNLSTNRMDFGTTQFTINKSGFYAVFYEYYWYPNTHIGAGSDTSWAWFHVELRQFNYGSQAYCQY